MRAILTVALVLTISGVVRAQEAIPREEALKAALQLCRDLPKLLDTPIPTDPDVKRVVGIHGDKRGALVLPEARLASLDLAKVSATPVAIGQMWMLRLVPLVDQQPVKAEKLKVVTIASDQGEAAVTQFTLAVRKSADGQPELVVFGKDQQPLWNSPLTKVSEKQEYPLEMSAEIQGDGAAVTLKILGSYTAKFSVTAAD